MSDLTRDGDSNPSLQQRAQTAAHHGADVFVSLHANGAQPAARGSEVYVHDQAGTGSQALAGSLARALSQGGVPQRGTFRAPFRGTAPTGRSYELVAMEWFHLQDGKIHRRWGAIHR